MNKRALGADVLLLLTAAIWGFGFVAQRSGMEYLGPFAFNGIRFFLGSLSLFPIIALSKSIKPSGKGVIKRAIMAALLAGSCCFIAVSLQQLGIIFTTAGNAGFITGFYVIITPILGIFLGRKTGPATWIGAVFTLSGLYFISISGQTGVHPGQINPGDIIIAAGSVFWAFHVLVIDRLVKKTDPIVLSSGQFAFCGLFSLAAAFLAEPSLSNWLNTLSPELSAGQALGLFYWKPFPALISGLFLKTIPLEPVSGALIPILFGSFASVGIAYTLQVIAQRDAPPAHATIILCMEGSFAALGGVLLLHEPLGRRTVLGFVLMLAGMLISQWELIVRRRTASL